MKFVLFLTFAIAFSGMVLANEKLRKKEWFERYAGITKSFRKTEWHRCDGDDDFQPFCCHVWKNNPSYLEKMCNDDQNYKQCCHTCNAMVCKFNTKLKSK